MNPQASSKHRLYEAPLYPDAYIDILTSAEVEDYGSDSDCLLEYDAVREFEGDKHVFLGHQCRQRRDAQPRLAADGKSLGVPGGDGVRYL